MSLHLQSAAPADARRAAKGDHRLSLRHIAAQLSCTAMCFGPPTLSRRVVVAEHALLVVRILESSAQVTDPRVLLAGLHHRSDEALIGDLSRLNAAHASTLVRTLARQVQHDIETALGIAQAAVEHRHLIAQADRVALATEQRDLALHVGDHGSPQPREVEPWEGVDLREHTADADHWRRAFIARHQSLAQPVPSGDSRFVW